MLWVAECDARVIGWVNVATRTSGRYPRIAVEAGFVGKRPGRVSFRRAFNAEMHGMEKFLEGIRSTKREPL